MRRVCRNCGEIYSGLVCHACHPRRKAEAEVKAEIKAEAKAEVKVESETGDETEMKG